MIKSVSVSHVALSRRTTFPRGLVVSPVYRLRDYADDEVKCVSCAEELQKTRKSDDIYKIEKILAEKKENGKVKVLVKWLGHDKKFQQLDT